MKCHEIRDRLDNLWESAETAEVRGHLTQCAACSQHYRELRWLRSGFALLKSEEAPAPSLGFAERLVRQLGEMSNTPSVAEFFERVGRRFVYATLVLTFLALLALALPATGPLRGLSATDIQITSQQEATLAYSDPVGDPGGLEVPEAAPAEMPAPSVTDEVR